MKPAKKSDKELLFLLKDKINKKEYRFLKHAKQRQKERHISDLDVIRILRGDNEYCQKRNKKLDKYEEGREDWNYCIEGKNIDNENIRVIISFEKNLMPIITVINLVKREAK
ncbi:DUF4258 domain-containing protein [Thiotrichales bacterium 19S9-12]|nr:DUF4258 domain-containing protein [Thiotrichales bacterium 19S9-11]MCF6812486.1 DUF4258 domain-containing protein [Thiotrichales bacterium 19S9-12]